MSDCEENNVVVNEMRNLIVERKVNLPFWHFIAKFLRFDFIPESSSEEEVYDFLRDHCYIENKCIFNYTNGISFNFNENFAVIDGKDCLIYVKHNTLTDTLYLCDDLTSFQSVYNILDTWFEPYSYNKMIMLNGISNTYAIGDEVYSLNDELCYHIVVLTEEYGKMILFNLDAFKEAYQTKYQKPFHLAKDVIIGLKLKDKSFTYYLRNNDSHYGIDEKSLYKDETDESLKKALKSFL